MNNEVFARCARGVRFVPNLLPRAFKARGVAGGRALLLHASSSEAEHDIIHCSLFIGSAVRAASPNRLDRPLFTHYDGFMQHAKYILALLSLSSLVAMAESAPEAACRQLRESLTQELTVLRAMTDASSAAGQLPALQAVLATMAAMDRSYEAEKALWAYIDNTKGVKMPLIELLQQIAIEFTRLEEADFYGHEPLRQTLAPQVIPPQKEPVAK